MTMATAVDASTDMAAVGVVESSCPVERWRRWWIGRQRQWQWVWWSQAGVFDNCNSCGCVDSDHGSGCGGVELLSVMQPAAVDALTVTMAVGVVESSCRVGRRRRWWMRRQRRRQWVWWSRAAESDADGGGGGCNDRDGGSGCVGVELPSQTQTAAVDASTDTAAVGMVKSSGRM